MVKYILGIKKYKLTQNMHLYKSYKLNTRQIWRAKDSIIAGIVFNGFNTLWHKLYVPNLFISLKLNDSNK